MVMILALIGALGSLLLAFIGLRAHLQQRKREKEEQRQRD